MNLPWLALPLALCTALSTTMGGLAAVKLASRLGDLIALSGGVVVAIALLDVLPEAELTPDRLARAMDASLERPGFPAPVTLDLGGAARSVEILARLAAGVRAARAQAPGRRS